MKKKYKVRDGFPFKQEDIEVIGTFIDVNFPSGQVSAAELVARARNKKSPIHKFFQWDDRIAAEKWRIHQAQKMIQAIIIEVDDEDVRAFHNVYLEDQDHSTYVDTKKILNDSNLFNQVLSEALRQATSWAARYKQYKELSPIVESINKTIKEIDRANRNNKAK